MAYVTASVRLHSILYQQMASKLTDRHCKTKCSVFWKYSVVMIGVNCVCCSWKVCGAEFKPRKYPCVCVSFGSRLCCRELSNMVSVCPRWEEQPNGIFKQETGRMSFPLVHTHSIVQTQSLWDFASLSSSRPLPISIFFLVFLIPCLSVGAVKKKNLYIACAAQGRSAVT